jgi:glycosyltransferase involved in cell wall biosynthesis
MRILLWHVHGAWTTAFVHGDHDYTVPVVPDRGPDGIGRARTYAWPDAVRELPPEGLRDEDFDLVVLQRPHELELAEVWLGRRPGRDVPAVYVEHNAPQGRINEMRHPAADREDLRVVHVTHFNRLFWDTGSTPSTVVEHGIVDPGYRYTGELPRAAVAINEARRRARVTGTDLVATLAGAIPYDLFGMDAAALGGIEDLPQAELHAEMARRRVYLHPIRWTSLGLSLIEAMHLAMPVVALAATEVAVAVPAGAGVVSARLDVLSSALRRFVAEPEEAALAGKKGRESALARYGLDRFLSDFDVLFEEVTA